MQRNEIILLKKSVAIAFLGFPVICNKYVFCTPIFLSDPRFQLVQLFVFKTAAQKIAYWDKRPKNIHTKYFLTDFERYDEYVIKT